MSTSDLLMINNENTDGVENTIMHNQVYKNLRRRSASLAFILTLFLPMLLFIFTISCTPRHSIFELSQRVYGMLAFDLDCLAIILGWLLIQSILLLLTRNKYNQKSNRISSHRYGLIVFTISLGGIYLLNRLNVIHASYVYDNIHKILIASIIVSYFIGILLFIKGSRTRHLKQINPFVAFFYGTDINLTIAGINLKQFLEYRAGLLGWSCLNLCFFLKTIELYTYRRPPAFLLALIQQTIQTFQLIWYENDRFINDSMKKETIGFLHVFGSLCWFPFLWCLPTQYLTLVNYPIKRLYIIGSMILFITGMLTCRSTHNQEEILKKSSEKNRFNDGIILITSNYWSLYRHSSYLGNFLILLSWSLPCGLMSTPWILPIYYLLIICHKSRTEDLVSH